jgi:hypothetical protein
MVKISSALFALTTAVSVSSCVIAFAPPTTSSNAASSSSRRYSSTEEKESSSSTSAFVSIIDEDETFDADKTFDAVEKFGKGAAKTKRGTRKGGAAEAAAKSPAKAFATLTPEETFYEGPPAITETLAPTLSIVTVVGIVPAAAAWARQAWVRYTITNRRIRVTSGIGGKDMAEIVYPDIVEIRTVKRLFGDGDMVFFLRDGAKFEMRNVPNFVETMEYILKLVDENVVKMYKSKGDVGAQQ